MQEITGRHVFAITSGAFAVIIGVNLLLAYKAVSTFPGLEVANSYVASQQFDEKRTAQQALGWKMTHSYTDGLLRLSFQNAKGSAVAVKDLSVLVGRSTEARNDIRPAFVWTGAGFQAAADLARGKWMMRVQARAEDGTLFEQRVDLQITE